MRSGQAMFLVLLTGFVGLATGNRLLLITVLVLLAMLAIGFVYRLLGRADVQGEQTIADSVIAWGGTLAHQITLTNTSRLAMPAVRVIDGSTLPEHPAGYVTNLHPRRSITWDISVPCQTRGRYRLGPVQMHMSDPLGLFPVSRSIGSTSSMLVLPRWVPLQRCALKLDGFLPGEARGKRRGESPPNVTSVREYIAGDSMSAIHWAASARMGNLMTKMFAPEVQTSLWLALDLDGDMEQETEELLVTAAASLALYGLRTANLRVGLAVSGALPGMIPCERGRPHSYRFQEILAEVHSGQGARLLDQLTMIDGRLGPGTAVVLLTSQAPDSWHGWLGRLMRQGVAARAVQVVPAGSPKSEDGWSVPTIQLPAFLADPVQERALIAALERGNRLTS